MPKITGVMPTRDRGNLIKESIQSVVDQTETDWELIIVDDHSSSNDKTEEIVKSFNDPRIRYYKLPDENGLGICAARNFGNALAEGQYIAIVDSDDICHIDRFKLSLEQLESSGADLVYGKIGLWNVETNQVINRESEKRINPAVIERSFNMEDFKKADFIPNPTVMYRQQLAYDFPYNSFFRKAEDYDFISRVIKYGYKIIFIPTTLVKYRDHKDSVTHEKSKNFKYNEIVKKFRNWV